MNEQDYENKEDTSLLTGEEINEIFATLPNWVKDTPEIRALAALTVPLTYEEIDKISAMLPDAAKGAAEIRALTALTGSLVFGGVYTIYDADTLGGKICGALCCLPLLLCLLMYKGYNWARITLGLISIIFAIGFVIPFSLNFFENDDLWDYIFFALIVIMFAAYPIVIAIMTLKNKTIKTHCKIMRFIRKKEKEGKNATVQ